MRPSLVLALLALAACGVPEEGPWMDPGANCLACHSSTGAAREVAWTAAGTVFSGDPATNVGFTGGTIELRDARGTVIELLTNGAGNFYTKETLVFPLRAALVANGTRREMPDDVETGACNDCHVAGGEADVPLAVP